MGAMIRELRSLSPRTWVLLLLLIFTLALLLCFLWLHSRPPQPTPHEPTPDSIGGFVWCDADSDTIPDVGEVGHGNVTVELYKGAGPLIATIVTDLGGISKGAYRFGGLSAGTYTVKIKESTLGPGLKSPSFRTFPAFVGWPSYTLGAPTNTINYGYAFTHVPASCP